MNFEEDYNKWCSKRSQQILGLDKTDPIAFANEYFATKNVGHISIDPNANISGISPNNFLSEIAKPFAKHIFFRKLFEKGKQLYGDNFSLRRVYEGDIYIHDATKMQPYCFGTSFTEVATEGRPGSSLPALPPKRFESFMGQSKEFWMELSQQFAGAIAGTDLVPWMAWFIEKGKGGGFSPVTNDTRGIGDTYKNGKWLSPDEMTKEEDYSCHDVEYGDEVGCYPNRYSDKEIENEFQSLVHVLNNEFRVGGDAPFTNISVNSKAVYDDIFKHYVFPDGKTVEDIWPTIERVQKIIVEFMSKGRPDGLPYRFPILTANFKADKKEGETKWFEYVAKANAKGMMNVNFAAKFSMCCRLSLDFDFKQNSFGGGGVKVGSARVGNINLPRLAYKAKQLYNERIIKEMKMSSSELIELPHGDSYSFEKEEILNFKSLLRESITADMEFLHAYWKVFEELIDVGYLKFFRDPTHWFDKSMFFLTVGFCGIWDAVEILIPDPEKDMDILAGLNDIKKRRDLFEQRLKLMREILDIFNTMTREKSNGVKFNVEEVPSEGAAGTMAKFNYDFGETKIYYSNQFIPLQMDIPLEQRIKIEAEMQSKLTGGGMTFLNFDSPLTPEQAYHIHKYMLEMGFNGQFCINYGYTKCNDCQKVENGIKQSCSCGSTSVKNYTRVVGYLAEIHSSAKSKEAEILDRKSYDSSVSI